MISRSLFFSTIAISSIVLAAPAEDWPQFRGSGGSAISETATPPIYFGESSNLLWKIELPPGYSSPVVSGRRIFLTAVNDGWLETLCLDRKDGHLLWRKQAPTPNPDTAKNLAQPNPATPTPVTDGKSVYVLFGHYGLLAYDFDGKELWRKPFSQTDDETSSSPILIEDNLIMVSDKNENSFVEARDKKTGAVRWHTERPQFRLSRATPFHWVNEKRDELIIAASIYLTSYDPRTGKENWRYAGASTTASSTPAAGDGLLFSTSPKGEAGVNTAGPNFGVTPNAADGNLAGDGLNFLGNAVPARPSAGLHAIRSCGRGDLSLDHLAWSSMRGLPGYSSPVFYKNRLFTVKDGGLVSAYNVKTGEAIYQDERLDAPGNYLSSAVAANGHVYFTSENGTVTVIDAAANSLAILSQTKLAQESKATPAIVDQAIFFRTGTNLFAFSAKR